jgi:hypothetical protein
VGRRDGVLRRRDRGRGDDALVSPVRRGRGARAFLPRDPSLWIANGIAALVFGALHFGNVHLLGLTLNPVVVSYILLVNGGVGLLCGWLFRTRGIEAAMACHVAIDLVLHGLGAVFRGPGGPEPCGILPRMKPRHLVLAALLVALFGAGFLAGRSPATRSERASSTRSSRSWTRSRRTTSITVTEDQLVDGAIAA